ncbi:MAG: hypothetical protein IKY66_03520 [Bacteroidales bacterium]|nr:hypothetical protein [Bacteroidales bacterium]
MADEVNILDYPVHSSPAALKNKAFKVHDKTTGKFIVVDAQKFLSAEYKDLSMYDTDGSSLLGRSTANCYVIRAAGAYRFPIVYGNALKDGVANTAAYERFVNHLGNNITSPFIEGNANCMPKSAEICWQDEVDLLVNLEIVEGGDCKYIQFEVDSVPVTGANAVVAVKDGSGNIMWSWHIWVTSEDLTPVQITNGTPKVYDFMPVNIGWKWDSSDRLKGKNPHFQWGRKDPFPCPRAYNSTSIITTYGQRTFTTENAETNATTIADAIKRPYSFFYGTEANSYKWEPDGRLDLWCAGNQSAGISDNVIVKTIYDPCPVGWKVPNARVYTGFTTTGSNTSDATQFNVVGAFTAGWFFKRNSDDTVGHFFAASGCRSRDSGGLYYVGGYGYCWCAVPGSAANGRYLNFYSGYVYPLSSNHRAYGFSVRAVRESN